MNFAVSSLNVGMLSKTITYRKAQQREWATFDENRRAVGMPNPMCDQTYGTYRGGEGTTPVTSACPQEHR